MYLLFVICALWYPTRSPAPIWCVRLCVRCEQALYIGSCFVNGGEHRGDTVLDGETVWWLPGYCVWVKLCE